MNPRSPRRSRHGFSLLDVLTSLFLLVILLSILQTGEISLRRQIRSLERRARVLFLAQEYMELSHDELPSQGPAAWQSPLFDRDDGIHAVMYCQPWDSFPNMRLVTIKANWTDPDGGPEHQLVLTRVIPNRLNRTGGSR